MTARTPVKDKRDPRVPLDVPPFGEPAWARRCPKCELWYPWLAFHKPIRKRNGAVRGATHYVRCLVCRTADGAVTRKRSRHR